MIAQHGPKGSLQFSDFTAWAQAAKDRGLNLYGVTNGSVAQDGPRGTCRGFWGYNTQRGWLEPGDFPPHRQEGSLAEFDRYIAGDR